MLSAILPVVIVGLVGLFAVTGFAIMGARLPPPDKRCWKKACTYPCSRIRLARRHGDAHASAQQQALLEEMAGQPGVRWFGSRMNKEQS